ncbi:hypothetical protein [Paenalcaligenes faecalis]|uniref:hypothetical protein n=1 Tax=Paenalcaligenes faecalis TaxID=2980099 RepID=UPI0022B98565|nr:hypothetical protein [Paenalcaligenes faecalis]
MSIVLSDYRLSSFRKRKRKQRLSANGYTKISYGRSVVTGRYGETIDFREDPELWAELEEAYPVEVATKLYELEMENRQLRDELDTKNWQLHEAHKLNGSYFEASVHLHTHLLAGEGGSVLDGADKSYLWILEPIQKLLVEQSKIAAAESRREVALLAAKTRHKQSKEAEGKAFVKGCWERWRQQPERYSSKAAFARDMLDKGHNFNSRTIERWCAAWEREAALLA